MRKRKKRDRKRGCDQASLFFSVSCKSALTSFSMVRRLTLSLRAISALLNPSVKNSSLTASRLRAWSFLRCAIELAYARFLSASVNGILKSPVWLSRPKSMWCLPKTEAGECWV